MKLHRNLDGYVREALSRSPIVVLVGPRQCGKTTLARAIASGTEAHFFDLEDPDVIASLERPKATLGGLKGLIVIDEVQRRPELFPVLRTLVDREDNAARFLILGSASIELLRQASESLAGRIAVVELSPFALSEVGPENEATLWERGGFPRSFLAESERDSFLWREDFIRTFLERDLPQMGINVPALLLRRFWTMVAHYHGQTWNSSEVAGSLGVNDVTARKYLDLLAGAFMVRLLPPWFENLGKRQRKAPKVYLRDSGLLHSLLGIGPHVDLRSHPKVGSSFEGFAIEQVLHAIPSRDAYYWSVHGGADLDLLVHHRTKRLGFEFKLADGPTLTPSMLTAQRDLKLDALWVVYPGDRSYALADGIRTLPLADVLHTEFA